ncbi:hypothetical protein PHYPSEUDO_003666 [Phytophthora pseudosyringae]|uniref:Uncharacterized protein n=1 Tax=Phytophthora pseudosyringae TaxID=221518 RepID=A0A8T1VR49_9STRA|nr:hypothetical protein PHYPSEUDO_003666 [Phytophthora pseudosyringae]
MPHARLQWCYARNGSDCFGLVIFALAVRSCGSVGRMMRCPAAHCPRTVTPPPLQLQMRFVAAQLVSHALCELARHNFSPFEQISLDISGACGPLRCATIFKTHGP